jgi:hypothetical protein
MTVPRPPRGSSRTAWIVGGIGAVVFTILLVMILAIVAGS